MSGFTTLPWLGSLLTSMAAVALRAMQRLIVLADSWGHVGLRGTSCYWGHINMGCQCCHPGTWCHLVWTVAIDHAWICDCTATRVCVNVHSSCLHLRLSGYLGCLLGTCWHLGTMPPLGPCQPGWSIMRSRVIMTSGPRRLPRNMSISVIQPQTESALMFKAPDAQDLGPNMGPDGGSRAMLMFIPCWSKWPEFPPPRPWWHLSLGCCQKPRLGPWSNQSWDLYWCSWPIVPLRSKTRGTT